VFLLPSAKRTSEIKVLVETPTAPAMDEECSNTRARCCIKGHRYMDVDSSIPILQDDLSHAEKSPSCHRREQAAAIAAGHTLLHQVFERTAVAYPERPAVELAEAAIDGTRTVSYRRLNELASGVALALRQLLIEQQPESHGESVVGICCCRGGIEP